MNHHEAKKAFGDFLKTLPATAQIAISINEEPYKSALSCRVWPNGICGNDKSFSVDADEFDTLLDSIKVVATEYMDARTETVTRKMALAIIDLSDPGPCTDRELRLAGFSDDEITKYGDAACAKAAEMGGNAPFIIERTQTANAA